MGMGDVDEMEVTRTIAASRIDMECRSSSPGGLLHILMLEARREALKYKCVYGYRISSASTRPCMSLKHSVITQGVESQEISPLAVPASFEVFGNKALTGDSTVID